MGLTTEDGFVLVCLKCRHNQSPSTKTQYCPKDGSLLVRTRAPTLKASKHPNTEADEFEKGWQTLCEHLSEPRAFSTIARGARFTARFMPPATVVVTPSSSNLRRPISKSHFKEVYGRWLKLAKSYDTGRYEDMTVNSAYALRLLQNFFDKRPSSQSASTSTSE